MAIRHPSLLRQNLVPSFLGVIQNERYKLHQWLFLLVASRIRLAHCRRTRRRIPASQQRKKILFEDHTQHQENQYSANSHVHAAKLKSPTTSGSALIAAISKILARSTGCPFHGLRLELPI